MTFTTRDGLPNSDISCVMEDKEGNIWFGFGTEDVGVSRYDGQDFTNLTVEDGLPVNFICSILEDREGNIWFGTIGGCVSRYDGRGFQTIAVKDGLSCNFIRSILEDEEGYLWFGTGGGGVCKYDGRNFQEITTRDGLSHDVVEQIIQDRAGNFWFATDNGVTRYTPPKGEVKPRVRIIQAIADRVYEFPLNKGGQGVVPDSIETSARQVTFEYKGLSFRTKFGNIKYIYKLEGRDTDWSRGTRERRVSYENIEPGEYLFQVKAIDRDLNYSDAAQVKLRVIPDPRNHRIAQLEGELEERERAEMERMQRELEDARQIQQSLLPKDPPQLEGFEIAGMSLPAREVSGDFYDYLSLGQDVGIVLADVTGKSVKAAMVAALADGMLNAEIKGQRELWNSPGKILNELNMGLKPRLVRGMFTAMSLGIICARERKLLFSNAGMPYPIVKRGREVRELEVVGVPLGLMEGAEYQDLSAEMEGGDLVVFYSDGVIEATDETGEMYQTERLLELIQQANPGLSAQEMVDLVVRDVTGFVGGEETSDDISVVVIVCKE